MFWYAMGGVIFVIVGFLLYGQGRSYHRTRDDTKGGGIQAVIGLMFIGSGAVLLSVFIASA